MKTKKELKEEIGELVKMLDEEEGSVWASENETYIEEQKKKLESSNIQLKTLQERNAEVKQAIEDIEIINEKVGYGCNNEKEREMFRVGIKNGRETFKTELLQKLGLEK